MSKILIIVGSLAQTSVNKAVARFIADKYAGKFQFEFAKSTIYRFTRKTATPIRPLPTPACANKSSRPTVC
ncbi:hypothetical protein [Neisseria perflava]|uniref:hypothetical protein n=1 Tax=Neisseria perflava TaxID=33053 RepID=UPI00209E4A26|nr:hypothetical protein [Neisseria perflava]MCP1660965.1 NAD(P)H-dependent FMN reductase [Neisseria perflava]MCP1772973.1 NAD(P)H-dependent FMN reductase [Neisseria perflava]